LIRLRQAYGATGSEPKTNRRWTQIYADKKQLALNGDLRDLVIFCELSVLRFFSPSFLCAFCGLFAAIPVSPSDIAGRS
jgi:hypothetical protein